MMSPSQVGRATLRGLLKLKDAYLTPVPREEVEEAGALFKVGFGVIKKERLSRCAHRLIPRVWPNGPRRVYPPWVPLCATGL
jgi:hypothetical protein